MDLGQSGERAVRVLTDRLAISDCLSRYARGIDRLDRQLLLSVYHPDAVDDHGKFVGGPADFVDWALEMHQRLHVSHQHLILNHTCDIDGDVAHTETYYLFLGLNRSGPPWSMTGGRYLDRFERRDGHWAIARRLCLRDWAAVDQTVDPAQMTTLTSTFTSLPEPVRELLRSGPQSRRDGSDPSYQPVEVDRDRRETGRRLTTGNAALEG